MRKLLYLVPFLSVPGRSINHYSGYSWLLLATSSYLLARRLNINEINFNTTVMRSILFGYISRKLNKDSTTCVGNVSRVILEYLLNLQIHLKSKKTYLKSRSIRVPKVPCRFFFF